MLSSTAFIKDWRERMGTNAPLTVDSVRHYVNQREAELRKAAEQRQDLPSQLDSWDTLMAVLNAIGYSEEFAAAHPTLTVSEAVKLFLAEQVAGQPPLPTDSATIDEPEVDVALLCSMATCLDHGFGTYPAARQREMLDGMKKIYTFVLAEGEQPLAQAPDAELLVGMARQRHSDFDKRSASAQSVVITDMMKLYDEIVGRGYYQPENRSRYLTWLSHEIKGGERTSAGLGSLLDRAELRAQVARRAAERGRAMNASNALPSIAMNALPRVIKIYLAGGMRSGWQDVVRERCKDHPCVLMFIDPRESGKSDEKGYTAWDLQGVTDCDIVFGYLEKTNPSGAGLALEMGYARGLERAGAPRKHLIFVDDPEFPQNRYFGMARACSDVVVDTLDAGLDALIALLDELARPASIPMALSPAETEQFQAWLDAPPEPNEALKQAMGRFRTRENPTDPNAQEVN